MSREPRRLRISFEIVPACSASCAEVISRSPDFPEDDGDVTCSDIRNIGDIRQHLIHADASGDRRPAAVDQHGSPAAGKTSGKTVGVTYGHSSENRLPLCGECQAVARTFPGTQPADRCGRGPLQRARGEGLFRASAYPPAC